MPKAQDPLHVNNDDGCGEGSGQELEQGKCHPLREAREMCSWNPNLNLKYIYPWEPMILVGFYSTIRTVLYPTDL